jgi:hypothetical protein
MQPDTCLHADVLQGYEIPRELIVEFQPFTKENHMLTDAGKPARGQLRARWLSLLNNACIPPALCAQGCSCSSRSSTSAAARPSQRDICGGAAGMKSSVVDEGRMSARLGSLPGLWLAAFLARYGPELEALYGALEARQRERQAAMRAQAAAGDAHSVEAQVKLVRIDRPERLRLAGDTSLYSSALPCMQQLPCHRNAQLVRMVCGSLVSQTSAQTQLGDTVCK